MTVGILLVGFIVVLCVILNKISQKIGIPVLLGFIILGMLFGDDGILKIAFDNYHISEQICSVALIFIMFYGGFGTHLEHAKPVAWQAGLLASIGVIVTALITGLFCYYILRIELLESFLIGAVLSSTDAASVFSILRSKRLGLKENTDSLLEMESGSNDPTAYMLTMIILAMMAGDLQFGNVLLMVFLQIVVGACIGVFMAYASGYILRHYRFVSAGFDMAFVVAVALLAYALASFFEGNGYLSAYLCGLLLGNQKFPNKLALVHFFDGMTGLMQMLIFFLLGLLATPSSIIPVLLLAIVIMLFLTFVARPIAIFSILHFFKATRPQKLLVAFAGLRGASSIVFAIMAIVSQSALYNDVFHIVFCIVLLSISLQGSLLPLVARKLKMSDASIDVMKTFNDYSDEMDLNFIKVKLKADHAWVQHAIRELVLPPDTLIIMLKRDGEYIVPNGKTILREEDVVILSAHQFEDNQVVSLSEEEISENSKWIHRTIAEYSPRSNELVIMIIRGEKTIIPSGYTRIEQGDILVINSAKNLN